MRSPPGVSEYHSTTEATDQRYAGYHSHSKCVCGGEPLAASGTGGEKDETKKVNMDYGRWDGKAHDWR